MEELDQRDHAGNHTAVMAGNSANTSKSTQSIDPSDLRAVVHMCARTRRIVGNYRESLRAFYGLGLDSLFRGIATVWP